MIKPAVAIFALVAVCVCSVAPTQERRVPQPTSKPIVRGPRAETDHWQVPPRDVPPRLRLLSFDSQIVKRPVSYTVYLPPSYLTDARMRYPVVFLLPSIGGDCREFGNHAGLLEVEIKKGAAPEMILIGVQGIYASFFVDAKDGKRPIESVIMKELIQRVDATFRTVADREHRGIEGFSMGGWGAAHLGFKYPEQFGIVSMICPMPGSFEFFSTCFPEFTKDIWANDPAYFAENDPYVLAEKHLEKIRGRTKMRVYGGDADRFFVTTEDFHLRLKALGIEHEYQIVPKAPHNLNNVFHGVRPRIFGFWKEAFGPPYVPPPPESPTTQGAPPSGDGTR